MKQFFLNSLFLLSAGMAAAQSFDPTFGEGGITHKEENIYLDYQLKATVVAPSGSIYTLANNYVSRVSESDVVLRKFTKDGHLDTSFARNGEYLLNINWLDYSGDLIIDEAGHIILSGHTLNQGFHPFVVTLDSNGTYLAGGYVQVPYNVDPVNLEITSMTKHGISYYFGAKGGNPSNFYAFKTDQIGHVDTSFGNNGVVEVDFNGGKDFCEDIFVTDAGDILLAGYSEGNGRTKFAVAALDANTGALKTGFGDQGKLLVQVSNTGNDKANKLIKLPNGKLLLNGSSYLPTRSVVALASFDAQTGALDPNFDFDGKRVIYLAGKSDASEDAVVHNGQLYLAALSLQYNGDPKAVIVRLQPDGSNDNSFGSLGTLIVDHVAYSTVFLAFQGEKPLLSTKASGYLLMRLSPLSTASARAESAAVALDTEAMSVYPNPAVDRVTCTLSQNFAEELNGASLDIVDVYGVAVMQNVALLGNSIELPVAQLPAGLYTLKVTTSHGKVAGVSKFVVQP